MVAESVTGALSDAKLNINHIQQAVVGYVDGENAFLSIIQTFVLNFFQYSIDDDRRVVLRSEGSVPTGNDRNTDLQCE